MPSFHDSMRFHYKLAAVAICKWPFSSHYSVTIAQSVAPIIACCALLLVMYVYPIFFNPRHHKYLIHHVISILIELFLCFNAVVASLLYSVSSAPLIATLTGVHVLHHTATSLHDNGDTRKIINLLPDQVISAKMLGYGRFIVLLFAWLTVPRVNIDYEGMAYALFVPEFVGYCVCLLYRIVL